jgi:hypothetical protein
MEGPYRRDTVICRGRLPDSDFWLLASGFWLLLVGRGLVAFGCLASRAAAEQRHAVSRHLDGRAVVPFLVLPLLRLQAAFNVDLLALDQVLREGLGRLAPQVDAVPLGLFLLLAVAPLERLGRGDAELRDGRSGAREAQLGVPAQIANQDDSVHGSHRSFLSGVAARDRPPTTSDCGSDRSCCRPGPCGSSDQGAGARGARRPNSETS